MLKQTLLPCVIPANRLQFIFILEVQQVIPDLLDNAIQVKWIFTTCCTNIPQGIIDNEICIRASHFKRPIKLWVSDEICGFDFPQYMGKKSP